MYTGTAYLVEVFYLYNMQKQNHCRVGLLKNLIDQMIVLALFATSKSNRKTNLTTILVWCTVLLIGQTFPRQLYHTDREYACVH